MVWGAPSNLLYHIVVMTDLATALIWWICTMQLSFRLDKRPGESHLALDEKNWGGLPTRIHGKYERHAISWRSWISFGIWKPASLIVSLKAKSAGIGEKRKGQSHCPLLLGVDLHCFDDLVLYWGTWCSSGKHYFFWGVGPLLAMDIVVFIFIYESWSWTLHCDWGLLVSIVISTRIWSICARHHHIQRCALFLVILHRMVIWWFHRNYFALVLLETVWCRAELSALHHVSRCWNFILAERDVFGERTWDLREFCELEEHCTARFWLSTSFLIVKNYGYSRLDEPELFENFWK